MKLFSILFLAIAAQTHAEDDALPNLRGVVTIALTTGEERGFYGPYNAPECRTEGQNCSTTTSNTKRRCCGLNELGTTQELTCNVNESVLRDTPGTGYNGKCVVAQAEAPGEIDE